MEKGKYNDPTKFENSRLGLTESWEILENAARPVAPAEALFCFWISESEPEDQNM